jgi:hypothetical protein
VQRVATGDPDARDRAEQEPSDRMQVDVALDEVPEPCDLQQRGGVENVRSDDARNRAERTPRLSQCSGVSLPLEIFSSDGTPGREGRDRYRRG